MSRFKRWFRRKPTCSEFTDVVDVAASPSRVDYEEMIDKIDDVMNRKDPLVIRTDNISVKQMKYGEKETVSTIKYNDTISKMQEGVAQAKGKYYTPKFEEFHDGFDYEREEPYTGKWEKCVYDMSFTRKHFDKYSEEFRVKFLDREDIESFGVFSFDQDHCYHDKWIEKSLYYFDGDNVVKIVVKKETLFEGTIKNKSELKRVLKQTRVIS